MTHHKRFPQFKNNPKNVKVSLRTICHPGLLRTVNHSNHMTLCLLIHAFQLQLVFMYLYLLICLFANPSFILLFLLAFLLSLCHSVTSSSNCCNNIVSFHLSSLQYSSCLLVRTLCKKTVGDAFCSSLLQSNNALNEHFQGKDNIFS